jgi:ubiquinone/menaquinone biosynthesis C-methylase UbiE
VVATDASARQLASATRCRGVEYRHESADKTSVEAASCDLVTVAQALHWLDRPRFYDEVRRVARPGGVVAVWAYDFLRVSSEVDALVDRLANTIVGSFWPPERRYIDTHYTTLEFPFAEVETPVFDMVHEWTAGACLSYLRTWSAVRRYQAAEGGDPVDAVEEPLRRAWGAGTRVARFPLIVRVGTARPAPPRPE